MLFSFTIFAFLLRRKRERVCVCARERGAFFINTFSPAVRQMVTKRKWATTTAANKLVYIFYLLQMLNINSRLEVKQNEMTTAATEHSWWIEVWMNEWMNYIKFRWKRKRIQWNVWNGIGIEIDIHRVPFQASTKTNCGVFILFCFFKKKSSSATSNAASSVGS